MKFFIWFCVVAFLVLFFVIPPVSALIYVLSKVAGLMMLAVIIGVMLCIPKK